MKQNIYKVILLISLFVAGLQVNAQIGHEFSVYGGGGVSSLQYKLNNINNDDEQVRVGGMFGIGYTLFLNSQWGISTGLEYALYNSRADLFSVVDTHSALDDSNESFDFIILQRGIKEKQESSYLNIPLMLQFQTGEKMGFYASFGGKIGIPLKTKYKGSFRSIESKGYYPSLNVLYDDLEHRGFGNFEGGKYNDELDFDVSFMLSAEAGVKFKLTNNIAIYTGLYADYGLNDVVKGSKDMTILPYQTENPTQFINNSVLNSQYTHYGVTESFVDKVRPFAVGVKLRLSFRVD